MIVVFVAVATGVLAAFILLPEIHPAVDVQEGAKVAIEFASLPRGENKGPTNLSGDLSATVVRRGIFSSIVEYNGAIMCDQGTGNIKVWLHGPVWALHGLQLEITEPTGSYGGSSFFDECYSGSWTSPTFKGARF